MVAVLMTAPNDTTWREALRGAATAGDSDAAHEFVNMAQESHRVAVKATDLNATVDASAAEGRKGGRVRNTWSPDASSFEALVEAHVRDGSNSAFGMEKKKMYGRAVEAYCRYMRNTGINSSNDVMLPESIREVRQNPRVVLLLVQAAVSVELMSESRGDGDQMSTPSPAREIATELVALDCLREGRMQPSTAASLALDVRATKALELARSWVGSFKVIK